MLYMYSFNKLLHYFALIQPELKRMFRILQNQHLIHTTHGLASVTIILKPGRIDINTTLVYYLNQIVIFVLHRLLG
jgi:hypothetical protein